MVAMAMAAFVANSHSHDVPLRVSIRVVQPLCPSRTHPAPAAKRAFRPQAFALTVPTRSTTTTCRLSTTSLPAFSGEENIESDNTLNLHDGIIAEEEEDTFASIATDQFNADMEAVSSRSTPTSPSIAAATQAEAMLREALFQYDTAADSKKDSTEPPVVVVPPNRRSFELVMQAYLNLGRSRFNDPLSNQSSAESSSSSTICSADKLLNLHQTMEHLWEKEGRSDELAPTIDTFNAVLGACAACAGPRAVGSLEGRRGERGQSNDSNDHQKQEMNYAAEAELVLQRMQDLATEIYDDVDNTATADESSMPVSEDSADVDFLQLRPDATSYSLLAAAWARQQPMGPGGTSWAGYERHTFPVLEQDGSNNENNASAKKSELKANGECAAKAEERLRILEAMFVEPGSDDVVDNDDYIDTEYEEYELPYLLAEAYDDVLAAWARSGVDGSASKAEDVLRRWEGLADDLDEWTIDAREWEDNESDEEDTANISKDDYEEDLSPLSIIPTSEAYTTVILAHALSNSNLGPRKASDWLERTLDLYEKGMWGKHRPDLVAFNAVISGWASCEDDGAAEKAEQWLNRLEALRSDYDDDRYKYLSADVVSFNAALGGFTRRISVGRKRNGNDAENQAVAILKAQSIFDRMEILCISGENHNVCPNARTYASLIYAWTRSGLGEIAANSANDLLRKMEDRYIKGDNSCRPSLHLYSATINAYARTGSSEGAKKALEQLSHLSDLSKGGKLDEFRPDIVIYTSVLNVIAKTRMEGGAAHALQLLEELETIYEQTGDVLCKPNVRFYTAVILVLANCRQEGNEQRAQEILMKMEKLAEETGDANLLPNSFTYNYAINCAANTLGSLEVKTPAFKIALQAFQSLRTSTVDKPNSFTYALFLKACNCLLPLGDMRENVVKRTMEECCEAGMLTDEVLSRLRKGVPAELGREILQYPTKFPNVKASDLPTEWSRNVKRRSKRY